jgi:hypothetical protein
MSREKPYGLINPCSNCPFRTDVKPYLRAERVEEIERGLERGEFYCHKTTQHKDTDGDDDVVGYRKAGSEMHCAGALILLEKLERPSQMMRIAERLRMYDPSKLNMAAPVYDTFEDMIEAQEHRPKPKRAKRKLTVTR